MKPAPLQATSQHASLIRSLMQQPVFLLLRKPARWVAATFALLTVLPLMVVRGSRSESETAMPDIEQKLEDLGIKLPPVAAPVASYVPWTQSGKLLFLSGQIPVNQVDKTLVGASRRAHDFSTRHVLGLQPACMSAAYVARPMPNLHAVHSATQALNERCITVHSIRARLESNSQRPMAMLLLA